MTAFHDIRFPLRLSLSTSGGPRRRTDIVSLSGGGESRNARWQASRRSYDAGSGIRSLADLYAVLDFFEARAGELYGFRFRDPLDYRSGAPGDPPRADDQPIATGDGTTRRFQLVKTYGDGAGLGRRVIAKPVAGTLLVSLDGQPVDAASVSLDATTGLFTLASPPPEGCTIRAGYEFDVPVRFATDRLDISLEAFNAGRIPAIPLIEILP